MYRRTALQTLGALAGGAHLAATALLPTMSHAASPTSNLTPAAPAPAPRWTDSAVIYQINVRQFSAAGTLKAVQADLPRIRALGADILWVMPWQPIGQQNRKGSLGSYYSIADYTAINPEFGTLQDARDFVAAAQRLGLKVILDWVANHTAWDHPWATAHRDWYQLNAQGELFPVTFNAGTPHEEFWWDVIALNYAKPPLRAAMVEAMDFWVREMNLDGFRCDVASLVPTDFWVAARQQLQRRKPLFMLAESDQIDLHTSGSFDMSYGWDLADLFKAIGEGQGLGHHAGKQLSDKPGALKTGPQAVAALRDWAAKLPAGYPADALRMRFTSNHDFNSWHGTDAELYGALYPAFAVLSFTLPGLPLIYNGQEARLNQRLAFFEKDAIAWRTHELSDFYAGLATLKHRHPALAPTAALTVRAAEPGVFAFTRQAGADTLHVAVNLDREPRRHAGETLAPGGWQIRTAGTAPR